ncbi:hypothetical protein FYK55_18510, partial [Roseiconus nitratireducens]
MQSNNRSRANSELTAASDDSVHSHVRKSTESEVRKKRSESQEVKVTNAGRYEKTSLRNENLEVQTSESEIYRSAQADSHGGNTRRLQEGASVPSVQNQANDGISPENAASNFNIPDLDELADRIAATGYGGFRDGFGDSGSGGSGSDGSSSSS